MRTRRSNRTKRYTVEKYDFEGSSDEEALDRASKHAERDENFDETAAAEESAEELALGQEHDENEDAESDGPVSEPDGVLDRFARQRVKPIRPFNVRAAGFTGYLDLEPVADGRIVRSYWGPYDRGFKGKQLVEAWYGRHEDGVKLVTALSIGMSASGRVCQKQMRWYHCRPRKFHGTSLRESQCQYY
uniref:Uncharacterized protein n=1 Tax=Fusarium oxysporum (strain Fo5176) TaxID=660025 RepID=A0A0D2Y5P2_FUSOF